jgi:hypothetical protein
MTYIAFLNKQQRMFDKGLNEDDDDVEDENQSESDEKSNASDEDVPITKGSKNNTKA